MTDYQLLKTELDVLMVYEDEVDAVAQVLAKCHFTRDVERWVWTGDSDEILKNVPPTAQVAPPQPVPQQPVPQQPPGGTPVGQMRMQPGQMGPFANTPATAQLYQGAGLEGMTPEQMQAPQWQMQKPGGLFGAFRAPRFSAYDPVTGTQMGGAKGMTQSDMSSAADRMDPGAKQRQMYEQQWGAPKAGLGSRMSDAMNTALQSGWDKTKAGGAATGRGLARAGMWGADKTAQGFGAAGRGIDTAAQGIGSGYTGVKNWLSGKASGLANRLDRMRENWLADQNLASPERLAQERREELAQVMPGAEGNMGMFDVEQPPPEGVTIPDPPQTNSGATGPEGVTIPNPQTNQTGVWGGQSRKKWEETQGDATSENPEAAHAANEAWDAMQSGEEFDPAKHNPGGGFGPASWKRGTTALNRSSDSFQHAWDYLLKGL